MELIIATILIVALGILANRYGYDSRARLHSRERQMASYEASWRQSETVRRVETASQQPQAGEVAGTAGQAVGL